MGIAPIDLQNMYSQMSNVARSVAGQHQAAQVSESVQQQNQIQKNIEQSQKVQQAENDKANTQNVNADGHQGGAGTYQNPNRQKNKEKESKGSFGVYADVKSEYVGTIVDITR
ncbi:MAG: hypothetical protein IKX70_00520 [Treponema sp.]|nr:hypothetical protein [Treponema sp.]MBR5032137.1 hypothetical protein [Treponema sp.]